MYQGMSQLLVDNPINRYLINAPIASQGVVYLVSGHRMFPAWAGG
jgi:hypothetical protein